MTPDLPSGDPDRLVDALFLFLWILGAVAVFIVLAGIASIFRRRARRAMGPIHDARAAAPSSASGDAWSESGRRIAVAPEERSDSGGSSS